MSDNVVPFVRRDENPAADALREAMVDTPIPRQRAVLIQMAVFGERGMTWRDVSRQLGIDHGAASGLLSRLHQQGHIVRLSQTRLRCKVYVLPKFVNDRQIEVRANYQTLTDDMADMLRRFYKPCRHADDRWPTPTCKMCEVKELLKKYDKNRKGRRK